MIEDTKLLTLDLSLASPQVIEVLLEDAADSSLFNEILTANTARPEILRLVAESSNVPIEISEEATKLLQLPERTVKLPDRIHKHEEERRGQSLLLKIQRLTVGERIAIALRGGQDIRSILLKDANKEVVLTVLKNPKITETEVELIAHSRNVPEDALRSIHKNREWMKSYNITLALVNNPKTPPGIAITLVTGLRTKDIAILEKNRNISAAIRAVAKKLMQLRRPK